MAERTFNADAAAGMLRELEAMKQRAYGAEAEVERLREALDFYARGRLDHGERARAALQEREDADERTAFLKEAAADMRRDMYGGADD